MACRLCLSDEHEGNMENIFGQITGSINFVEKIYECTNLKLNNDVKLPNKICEICKSELIIWLKFKRQCIASNQILQSKFPHTVTDNALTTNCTEKCTQTDYLEITTSYVHDEEDDNDDVDDVQSNYRNEYELKNNEEKLFERNLVEYTEIEFDNSEMTAEFVDHTDTELQSTCKSNIFKINMEDIKNSGDESNNTRNNDLQVEVYCLLNLNGEEEERQDINDGHGSETYNNEEVEMLLESDENESTSLQDEYIPPITDIDNFSEDCMNSTTMVKIDKYDAEEEKSSIHIKVKKETKAQEAVKLYKGNRWSYSYTCLVCGEIQTNMKQHMLIHAEDLPFKCPFAPQCKRAFRQKSNLKNHINTHTGEKPYGCKLCPKKFSEPSGLRSHMVLHTKLKAFTCTDCGKSFGWSHTLKAHQRIHTQDRRHPCNFCTKRFLSAHALKKHIRTHTGERPFQCDLCLKKFNTSGNMLTHKRIHLKESTFSCHLCPEQFKNLTTLKLHVKNSHSITESDDQLKKIDENDVGSKIEALFAAVTKDD